jgi:hypothetical protein
MPKTSFLACNPTFEDFPARVTIDSGSQRILEYEALSPSKPIDGALDFAAVYQNDNTTKISAGFGSTFLLRALFASEFRDNGFINTDLLCDVATGVTYKYLYDKSSLAEGNNFLLSVEKAFSVCNFSHRYSRFHPCCQ